jgi:hypothetical protein
MTDAREDFEIEVDPADLDDDADPALRVTPPATDDPEVPAADAWEQAMPVGDQDDYRT